MPRMRPRFHASAPRTGIDTKNHRVLGRKDSDRLLHIALDLTGLNASRQRDARGEDLTHRVLASCPREDERDGGQQPRAIERNESGGTRLTTNPDLAVPRA